MLSLPKTPARMKSKNVLESHKGRSDGHAEYVQNVTCLAVRMIVKVAHPARTGREYATDKKQITEQDGHSDA